MILLKIKILVIKLTSVAGSMIWFYYTIEIKENLQTIL